VKEARVTRGVVTFLFYLPAVVIALTILADILSVYKFQAVFSFAHDALGKGELSPDLGNRFAIMDLRLFLSDFRRSTCVRKSSTLRNPQQQFSVNI
jgi:hypothetical protein